MLLIRIGPRPGLDMWISLAFAIAWCSWWATTLAARFRNVLAMTDRTVVLDGVFDLLMIVGGSWIVYRAVIEVFAEEEMEMTRDGLTMVIRLGPARRAHAYPLSGLGNFRVDE